MAMRSSSALRRAGVGLAGGALVVLAGAGPAPGVAPAQPPGSGERSSATAWTHPDGTTVRKTGDGMGAARSVAASDADLEPGFPVQTYEDSGSYHAGPVINATVADLDRDDTLEICASALAAGPLVCWDHTGHPLPGWEPGRQFTGVAYPSIGPLLPARRMAVVAGYGWGVQAEDRRGRTLPGWPVEASNYLTSGPSLAPYRRERTMAVLGEEDWRLHAYTADGQPVPGWPIDSSDGGQERHTPAVANLDGQRGVELVTASGWTSPGVYLFVHGRDGTTMPGYPLLFQGEVDTYPAVGDVDGDGALEVVIIGSTPTYPWPSTVIIVEAATGRVEGLHQLSGGVPYGSAPALAELDDPCTPGGRLEIVVQTEPTLEVVTWDGTRFRERPGFPVTWSQTQWIGESAAVVGDVDGDRRSDVVFTGQDAGESANGTVYAFSASGAPLARFPKRLPIGSGGMPAIADVDLDGRNEIAIKGSAWDGTPGWRDTLWLYDLGGGEHGRVEWGQFMHDAQHSGQYDPVRCPP